MEKTEREETREKKCSPLHATQQKANEYTGFCSPIRNGALHRR